MTTSTSAIPIDTKKTRNSFRAWLFNGLLIAVFALSTAIPVQLKLLPAGVATLPGFMGDWIGKRNADVSEERKILAPDTGISKMDYTNSENRPIQVSLVTSGQDLNNSIHRPERCLLAQGHENISRETFNLQLPDNTILPVARLQSTKRFQREDGEIVPIDYHSIYWFIGHKETTNSHYKRTFIDIRDRLTGGTAQQWAYVSISAPILTDNLETERQVLLQFAESLAGYIIKL